MSKNILQKIKDTLIPSEKEYNKKFRELYIPDRFNQIELVDHLENEDIDHYISISNRTDGKSFNYIHYFMDYSIRKDIGFMLIARHYTVRFSYQKLIQEIIDDIMPDKYDKRKFHFIRYDFYILVGYEDKEIGIITDLNQATDLKYISNYLKHFPILIYDEFLALEGDYLIDEWDRLKTIYSSVDRKGEIPHIKHPKLFYLGNAVNFSSPVLAHLNIFNHLEDHPINKVGLYGNVALEMRRNDNANDDRNLRAFREDNDLMTMGEFEVNNHNLATDDYIEMINKDKIKIVIKGRFNYMVIEYHRITKDILLSITTFEEDYHFNIELKDNTEKSIYLDEGFYSENHYKKYNRDLFKFKNQYSKETILGSGYDLSLLNIYKIITIHESQYIDKKEELKEEQQKETYIYQSKKALFDKFFSGV